VTNVAGSTGGWNNTLGFGALYLPDQAYATLDVSSLNLGGFTGADRFVLEATVYVGATNYLQGSGVGVFRTGDMKGPEVAGGGASGQGCIFNDKSWFNTNKSKNWGLAVGTFTKLQIDYGYTTAGKFTASYWGTSSTYPNQWVELWSEAMNGTGTKYADVHPSEIFRQLRIGDDPQNLGGAGWTQAYYTAVKIQALIPEPGSFVALGAGMIGMVGYAIRRRK